MLPSLQSPTKAVSIDAVHRKKKSQKRRNKPGKDDQKSQRKSSLLPDIKQGFLTSNQWEESMIESRSMRPSKTRVKQRGGGFREYVNPNLPNSRSIGSYRTPDLPLSSMSFVSRGWSIQNPNPRLMKLQNVTGRFQKDEPFAYGNIFEYKSTKTVANPHIEFLYHHRLSNSREQPRSIHTNGSVATLYDRFHCPPINTSRSNADHLPSTKTQSIPSYLPSVLDEGCCVHRKACNCDKTAEEKHKPPARDLFKRWERSSRSMVSETSMHSSSGSSLCDQNGESNGNQWKPNGPAPNFPKRTPKKSTGLSPENARKTMKKVISPRTDSQEKLYDKRRRSTHTTSNTSLNKKSKSKLKLKPEESSSTNDVLKDEIKTAKDETESKEEKFAEPELVIEEPPKEIEMDLISIESHEKNHDIISEAENETMVTIPCDVRRAATPKILQIHSDGFKDDDQFSILRNMFTKLDGDGDGHLSFNELKRSLPSDLTKRQLDYLKKIYVTACESTFFGFEEFVAVHQMCDLIAHVKHAVFKRFESVDISEIDESLPIYLDLFNDLDEKQTGSIDATKFKELLSSAMNLEKESNTVESTLASVGKTNNDMVSKVELLAFLPFFISIASSGT